MQVLIVDDTPTSRKLLRAVLEDDGHTTVEAADGVEALALLERNGADAIISDILMPRMDGYQLCYNVRKDQRFQTLPFIIYTATFTSQSSARLASEVGADLFLKKPAPNQGILDAVMQFAGKKASERPAVAIPDDHNILKEYSAVLVTKLEKKCAELEQSKTQLTALNEELARSNVELERFAYVASHDLQEPMRTVQSFAQLLQRSCGESLKPDSAEYLAIVVGGVRRMQSLIRDLLAYSRVGSQGGAFASADCKDICDKVLENLKASIETNQANVMVDPLPVVIGDATQLGQVFQNLLVNAIKFHGERTPQIRVSVKEAAREWVFSIRDNGIGIASKYFERIFIIFQRLHTIQEYGGTGIGLAICKKIVERHGGRIWLESTVGEGSTFLFTVPKRQVLA